MKELVYDSFNMYVHNDVPPSQNEQYDIWIWDDETIPENVCFSENTAFIFLVKESEGIKKSVTFHCFQHPNHEIC